MRNGMTKETKAWVHSISHFLSHQQVVCKDDYGSVVRTASEKKTWLLGTLFVQPQTLINQSKTRSVDGH